MREHTESPVHVYQEIDTVDTVDYDVVKSEQGDQLELDLLILINVRNGWYGIMQYIDSVNHLSICLCHGLKWIVDVLI